MTKEQFDKSKLEIVKAIAPHLSDPERFGPPNVTLAECALIMSSSEKHIISSTQVMKIEKRALKKLSDIFRLYNISSAAECFPVKRF